MLLEDSTYCLGPGLNKMEKSTQKPSSSTDTCYSNKAFEVIGAIGFNFIVSLDFHSACNS